MLYVDKQTSAAEWTARRSRVLTCVLDDASSNPLPHEVFQVAAEWLKTTHPLS